MCTQLPLPDPECASALYRDRDFGGKNQEKNGRKGKKDKGRLRFARWRKK